MRTIGHLDHPTYKITALEHNNKITLQIEEGLFTQSYAFRDGGIVNNMGELQSFVSASFLEKITSNFESMKAAYYAEIKDQVKEEFDEII